MKAYERIEWLIAYGLALISAATASLYGFMSAAAGLFGVAFVGCHGPAWIVKATQRLGWPGAMFGFVVTAVCLGATLWGGLGTNASGGETLRAERTGAIKKQADEEAELKRVLRERADMPAFVAATAQTVSAARDAVKAAEAIRQRECGNGDPKQRGLNCRQRETEEKAKHDALAAILAAKDATDKAAQLDAEAATIRTRHSASNRVTEIDPQASAFSQLTGIGVATSAALNAFWLSLAFELGAMFAMMLAYTNRTPQLPVTATDEAVPIAAQNAQPIAPLQIEPPPAGDVRRFMLACLPRATGNEATWGAIYARYQRWCADQTPPASALDLNAFGDRFRLACERARIRTQKRGGHAPSARPQGRALRQDLHG